MIDKEQFDYTMHKIRQSRGLYHMSNEKLAEEMLPYIKQIMPNIQLVKCGDSQWYALNRCAIKRLEKQLVLIREKKAKELEEINCTISKLNDN